MNFHPPKWFMYLAIALIFGLLGLFVFYQINTGLLQMNKWRQQEIETVKQQQEQLADSLYDVQQVELQKADVKIDSLVKKTEAVKAKANTERKKIFLQYEKAIQAADTASDAVISNSYDSMRCRFDSLFK